MRFRNGEDLPLKNAVFWDTKTQFVHHRNIKMDLLDIGLSVVTGLAWLRIGTGGELL
jgi:hypothetical protein